MFYKLPEEQRYQHHEAVLSRIISSPQSRDVANTYIYRSPFKEKMIITRMLNEWNRDTYTTEPTSTVIRPEAVPVIKDWLNTAQDYEISVAKKLLSHLSKEKKNHEESDSTKSGNLNGDEQRPASINNEEQHRSALNTSSGGRLSRRTSDMSNVNQSKSKYQWRPQTSDTINKLYPNGDTSNVFQISRRPARLTTAPASRNTTAQRQRSQTERPVLRNKDSSISNSYSVFGQVSYPANQEERRPATNHERSKGDSRLSAKSRPGTRNQLNKQGRGNSKDQSRQNIRSNTMQKQLSLEKMKFSANLQNATEDDIAAHKKPAPRHGCETCRDREEKKNQNKESKAKTPISTYEDGIQTSHSKYGDEGQTPHSNYEDEAQVAHSQFEDGAQAPASIWDDQTPRSAFEAGSTYAGGQDTYRDLGLKSHYPGRRYYPSQFLL